MYKFGKKIIIILSTMTTSTKLTNEQIKEQILHAMELFEANIEILKRTNEPIPKQEELENLLLALMPHQFYHLTAEELRNQIINQYMIRATIRMRYHASEMSIEFPIKEKHRKLFSSMKKLWEADGFIVAHEIKEISEISDKESFFYVNISW
jgi:hypothetical protein